MNTTTTTTVAGAAYPISGHRQSNDELSEEEQLRLAMEESAREHRSWEAEAQRQQTEEEIVLEYVKRQSLAEEEYRKRKMTAEGVGKGKDLASNVKASRRQGAEGGEETNVEEEDEDEDLKRAIEESLRHSGGGDGDAGPSRSRGGV